MSPFGRLRTFGRRGALPLLLFAACAQLGAASPSYPAPDRPVAPIVSARWGSEAERDRAGEVDQIIERLGLKPGDRVADVGAGAGYDALRLAERLGPRSLVIAEDVDKEPLAELAAAARRKGLTNIRTVVGAAGDPRLPRALDAVIMIHMYHEISDPFGLLAHVAADLKPSGRLGIEELDRPTAAHGSPPTLLKCELAAMGYRLHDLGGLPDDLGYFAVFQPPLGGRAAPPARVRPCRAGA